MRSRSRAARSNSRFSDASPISLGEEVAHRPALAREEVAGLADEFGIVRVADLACAGRRSSA